VIGAGGGWENHISNAGFERSQVNVWWWWCDGEQGGGGNFWVKGLGVHQLMQHCQCCCHRLHCRHVIEVVVGYHFQGLLLHSCQECSNVDVWVHEVGGVRCRCQWRWGVGGCR